MYRYRLNPSEENEREPADRPRARGEQEPEGGGCAAGEDARAARRQAGTDEQVLSLSLSGRFPRPAAWGGRSPGPQRSRRPSAGRGLARGRPGRPPPLPAQRAAGAGAGAPRPSPHGGPGRRSGRHLAPALGPSTWPRPRHLAPAPGPGTAPAGGSLPGAPAASAGSGRVGGGSGEGGGRHGDPRAQPEPRRSAGRESPAQRRPLLQKLLCEPASVWRVTTAIAPKAPKYSSPRISRCFRVKQPPFTHAHTHTSPPPPFYFLFLFANPRVVYVRASLQKCSDREGSPLQETIIYMLD